MRIQKETATGFFLSYATGILVFIVVYAALTHFVGGV